MDDTARMVRRLRFFGIGLAAVAVIQVAVAVVDFALDGAVGWRPVIEGGTFLVCAIIFWGVFLPATRTRR
jgi:hypothetical protein